jgi:hypothetical protein
MKPPLRRGFVMAAGSGIAGDGNGEVRLSRQRLAFSGEQARKPASPGRNPAAGVGFEPTGHVSRPAVFKTAPFVRSGTPPEPPSVARALCPSSACERSASRQFP